MDNHRMVLDGYPFYLLTIPKKYCTLTFNEINVPAKNHFVTLRPCAIENCKRIN